jgi:hypothetical protein
LLCLARAKVPERFGVEGFHAVRGQARSTGDFIVANSRESAPGGCTSTKVAMESGDCSSTDFEPPTEIFPSFSWVELDDVEAKASSRVVVTKSLMKCPYSRKRMKCRGMVRSAAVTSLYELERTATSKKKPRKPGKDSSDDDHPPCLPYIIIG